ncbi:MAG TPA: hypothetical protein VFW62_09340, partial [bacterium]|nr:hypothetical protein [bacterium]
HEAAGIPAGKAKPPPKASEVINDLLDKAANFLFPNDGGGSGGLATANGAPLPSGAKAEPPKGPPAVYMAGRGRGTSRATKITKTAPAEPANPPAEKAANDNQYHEVIGHTLKPGDNIDAALLALATHFNNPAKIVVINCQRPLENTDILTQRIKDFDAAARIEIHQPGKPPIEVPGKSRMDQIHTDAVSDGQMLMWEASPKGVRDLFEVPGKDGQIYLATPEGVKRIEITTLTPLSKEDIAYLTTRARDLKVEIEVSVHGGRKMTFESTAEGLKVTSDKATNAEEINALVDLAVHHGEKIEITTPDGKIEIQNGATAKDSKVFTSEAKLAALAPERITLKLDKAPSPTELQALKDQGIQNILFKHDTSSANWFVESIELMKASQGLNIRAVDPSGKFMWENVVKPSSETLTAQSEIFMKGLASHAKTAGWVDRLAETRNLLGTEGQRFQFAGEALRWAASHDISDASIPKGKTEPTITPEQVDTWIKRGAELANTKHAKAREKGRDKLSTELAPFTEGLSLDPAKTGGWNQAVDGLKAYLAKDSRNPALAGKLFEILNREPTSSSAYENNAYDLANHLAKSENPHTGIKALVDFAANSTGLLKIEGSYFGSFFKASTDTGAKAEVETFNDLVTQAGVLTAQGRQVVIEAIPTSKMLEGTTPDIAVTVTDGAMTAKYFVEIKRAGRETITRSGANAKEFTTELEAGYTGKKSDDS